MAIAKVEKKVCIIPAKKELNVDLKISTEQLRVAAYCRVSTQLEQQELSYEQQIDYYTNLINGKPEWEMAGIYADEGITGTNLKTRKNFNRMIQDCMQDKIDMVITKSFSRFARNTVDTLQAIRKLKEKEIAIFFEKENINTLDTTGEMLITILSSQAQEESRNISENTKWGKARAMENGKIFVNHTKFMGYTKNEEGELVKVEEEAKIVQRIFREYLEGKSYSKIKASLEKDGILTATGRKEWSVSVIDKMLSNEKYMGDVLQQKTYTLDYLTKKRKKNEGQVRQYYIENNHEPIIPKELFYKVQQEKLKRSTQCQTAQTKKEEVKKKEKKGYSQYILGNIMICGDCGQPYRRLTWTRDGVSRIVWRCKSRVKNGTKDCGKSPTIDEYKAQNAVMKAINRFETEPAEFQDLLSQNLIIILGNYADNIEAKSEEVEEQIKQLESKMLELIKGNTDLNDKDFIEEYKNIGEEIRRLKLNKLSGQNKNVNKELSPEILSELRTGVRNVMEFDDALVKQVVERIKVINEFRIEIEFKSGKIISERVD